MTRTMRVDDARARSRDARDARCNRTPPPPPTPHRVRAIERSSDRASAAAAAARACRSCAGGTENGDDAREAVMMYARSGAPVKTLRRAARSKAEGRWVGVGCSAASRRAICSPVRTIVGTQGQLRRPKRARTADRPSWHAVALKAGVRGSVRVTMSPSCVSAPSGLAVGQS